MLNLLAKIVLFYFTGQKIMEKIFLTISTVSAILPMYSQSISCMLIYNNLKVQEWKSPKFDGVLNNSAQTSIMG